MTSNNHSRAESTADDKRNPDTVIEDTTPVMLYNVLEERKILEPQTNQNLISPEKANILQTPKATTLITIQ